MRRLRVSAGTPLFFKMKFRESDYDRLYRRLYRMFDRTTPLRKDCGVLCDKACCRGDEQTGMLLFPYEKTTLKTVSANGFVYAICSGDCKREERPLACRIFPLFPVIDGKGNVHAAADLRGYGICPLARHAEQVRFSKKFIRRVRKAGRILRRDEACEAFLVQVSDEITQLCAFTDRIEADDPK